MTRVLMHSESVLMECVSVLGQILSHAIVMRVGQENIVIIQVILA